MGEVPVMEVQRIYYRNDPIMLGAPPLKPPNNFIPMPLGAGILWDQLERAGIPEVKGVWGYVYGSQTGPFTVVAIKQAYAGHAKQTLLVAAGARAGAYGGKFVCRGRRRCRHHQSRRRDLGDVDTLQHARRHRHGQERLDLAVRSRDPAGAKKQSRATHPIAF